MKTKVKVSQIRNALADYIDSEGCGCCRESARHEEAIVRLGKLLGVPKWKDGSGYDFAKYMTRPKAEGKPCTCAEARSVSIKTFVNRRHR